MNQPYVPFSSSSAVPASSAANLSGPESSSDFLRMLERAMPQAAEPSQSTDGNSSPLFAGVKANIDKTSELYEACLELETFLLKTLITSMRNTVQKSGLVDTGFAGEIYEDMLYDEYTKEFTKNANFGFAEMAYLELTGQRGKYINTRVI
jgi:flagellar protein FlgJ